MYEMWSCVIFYHLLNRFLQPDDGCVSTSWKWLNIEVYTDIHGFILLYKEQISQKLFRRTRKTLNIFKNVPEKNKNFKSNWVVLAHSKPNIFSVGQPWCPPFIWDLAPPPSQLFQCCNGPVGSLLQILKANDFNRDGCITFIVQFPCRKMKTFLFARIISEKIASSETLRYVILHLFLCSGNP